MGGSWIVRIAPRARLEGKHAAPRGTRELDATGIAVLQQRLGAQIDVGVGLDTSQIGLSALNTSLDAAMELLAEIARHPAYRDADLERLRIIAAGVQTDKTAEAMQ